MTFVRSKIFCRRCLTVVVAYILVVISLTSGNDPSDIDIDGLDFNLCYCGPFFTMSKYYCYAKLAHTLSKSIDHRVSVVFQHVFLGVLLYIFFDELLAFTTCVYPLKNE
jgi:hypothetical protein